MMTALLATAWAADTTVCAVGPPECDFDSLQDAIDASNTGDTVHLLESGTWIESLDVSRTVTIAMDAVPAPIWQPVAGEPVLTVRDGGSVDLVEAWLAGGTGADLVVVESGGALRATGGTWSGASRTGSTLRVDAGASAQLTDVSLIGGLSSGDGGAIAATGAVLSLTDVRLEANQAARGAGLFVSGGALTVRRLHLCDNVAAEGGGLYAESAELDVDNVFAVRNDAVGAGGAMAVRGSVATIHHLTAFDNAAYDGAVLHTDTADVLLSQSAIVQSAGVALAAGAGASVPTEIVLFWANQDGNAAAPLAPSNLAADPRFVNTARGPDCGTDLRPGWDSPMVDAGLAAPSDLDGSPQDLGATGGPHADPDGWVDADGDGSVAIFDCAPDDAGVAPGLPEECNGWDDDCDGALALDEVDSDADGSVACPTWGGAYGVVPGDCDDLDGTRHPGAIETCDDDDDDCNGVVDDNAIDAPYWLVDADQDGFGGSADGLRSCAAVDGRVERAGDCDDASAATYPGAPEACDDVDADCDGLLLDPEAVDAVVGWTDADADGFGSPTDPVRACPGAAGIADNDDDCNDTDAAIFPGSAEVWYDGVDGDCAGGSDFDADGDGLDASAFGGTDCDDLAASIHPGARDEPADGVDQDCNGVDPYSRGDIACNAVGVGPAAVTWLVLVPLAWRRSRRRL